MLHKGGGTEKNVREMAANFANTMDRKFADPKQSMNAKRKTHKENDHHTTVRDYSHIII